MRVVPLINPDRTEDRPRCAITHTRRTTELRQYAMIYAR
jgi:hypothetical protein